MWYCDVVSDGEPYNSLSRIQELETHYSHLKIEMNDNALNEEEIDSTDKRNISE